MITFSKNLYYKLQKLCYNWEDNGLASVQTMLEGFCAALAFSAEWCWWAAGAAIVCNECSHSCFQSPLPPPSTTNPLLLQILFLLLLLILLLLLLLILLLSPSSSAYLSDQWGNWFKFALHNLFPGIPQVIAVLKSALSHAHWPLPTVLFTKEAKNTNKIHKRSQKHKQEIFQKSPKLLLTPKHISCTF